MARRKKNSEAASPAIACNVALADAPDVTQPATMPVETPPAPPLPRQKEAPPSCAAPPCSEWDRVQHVYDWFAVYLWIGCMIAVTLLNVADAVKMSLGR